MASRVGPVPPGAWLLLVDDDKDLRELLAEVLEASGFVVQTACNGHEALQLLKAEAGTGRLPHAIVLDLHMPVMDGWEFRARQKVDPLLADIPVVTMSSDWEGRADAHTTLRKPLDLDTLIAALLAVG